MQFYYKEEPKDDGIFPGLGIDTHYFKGRPNDDKHYNSTCIKIHIFKDTHIPIFSVIDGVANTVMYAPRKKLREMIRGSYPDNSAGVFIIKSYVFHKHASTERDILSLLNYWDVNIPKELGADSRRKFEEDLSNYRKNLNMDEPLTLRLINFIPIEALANKTVHYNNLINGFITKDVVNFDINIQNNYHNDTNKIEIKLGKDYTDYWLTLGNEVIHLKGNSELSNKNSYRVLNGYSNGNFINIKNLDDHNIFTSKKEAIENKNDIRIKEINLKLKGEELEINKSKIKLEESKIKLEMNKLNIEASKIEVEVLNNKVKILNGKKELQKLKREDFFIDTIIQKFVHPVYMQLISNIFSKRK